MKVLVCFSTINIVGATPCAGAPVRSIGLNRELNRHSDIEVRYLLLDVGTVDRHWSDWPFESWIVPYGTMYERPEVVVDALRDFAPDLVVCNAGHDVVRWGAWLTRRLGACLVYEVHDDEAAVFSTTGASAEDVSEAALVQDTAFEMCDAVVALTDQERALAVERGVPDDLTTRVGIGVDVLARTPWGPETGTMTLLFIGNLYYRPNADAVSALCDVVLPALRAARIEVDLRLVGRAPGDLVERLASPQVRFCGMVEDLDSAIEGATFGVAPLSAGSGTKSKVLDYLAAGLPTVVSEEGARGLPERLRSALVVEDDLRRLPRRLAAMWADPAALNAMGARARRAVEDELDWSRLAASTARFYRRVADHGVSRYPAARGVPGRVEALRAARHGPQWWQEMRQKSSWGFPPTVHGDDVVVVPRDGLARTAPTRSV